MALNPVVRLLLALMIAYLPCWAVSVNQQGYIGAGIPYELRDSAPDNAGDIADIIVDALLTHQPPGTTPTSTFPVCR